MGLKIETWNVAYRKRCRNIFDKSKKFQVIKNGYKGWYADPFLFDYEDDTYLFAEYFSYKLNRGVIACAKYNEQRDKFGDFKEIIVEDFHLSYPVVFQYDGKIYMMPETGESNSLFMYEAVSFPNEWKRLPAVMTDIRLVDTTPIIVEDKLYALSLRVNEEDHTRGELILLEYNNGKFEISSQGILSQDMSEARPGGHFIREDNKWYRVSQDCGESYGKAINIMEVAEDFQKKYCEELKQKIYPEEVLLDIAEAPSGIHTYNNSKDLEVVDLKFYRNSFYRIIWRILSFIR